MVRWRWVVLALLVSSPTVAQLRVGLRSRHAAVPTVTLRDYDSMPAGRTDAITEVLDRLSHPFITPPPWLDGAADPRTFADLQTALASAKTDERARVALRICELLERELVASRGRLAVADPSPAGRREQHRAVLVRERELERCLVELATNDSPIRPLATHRLAYFYAAIAAAERRDEHRARALVADREDSTRGFVPRTNRMPPVENAIAHSDCAAEGDLVADYECGWAALRTGRFEVAIERLAKVLSDAGADRVLQTRARVGLALANAMTAPEDRIGAAIATAPANERARIVDVVTFGLRLAGRREVAASLSEQHALRLPVGGVRCNALLAAARERAIVVELDATVKLLQLAAADIATMRANKSPDRERCEADVATTASDLARRWHSESRKTLSTTLVPPARGAYRIYIELFPAAPDIREVTYFAAELAWSAAEIGLATWSEVAAHFEAALTRGPVGKIAVESAYALLLAIQNAQAANQPLPSLDGQVQLALRVYDQLPPDKASEGWIAAAIVLRDAGQLARAAPLLARASEVDPEPVPLAIDTWARLGDWTALDAFIRAHGDAILKNHSHLREELDEAAMIAGAKLCESKEADRAAAGACYRDLAADRRAAPYADWARDRAAAFGAK